MVKYAQTPRCRRSFLLGYFGDAHADRVHCGRCDNCGSDGDSSSPVRVAAPIDTPAGHEVILKVLSGVARAKGRFGKTLVAQMLKGSGSEKMDRWGLKKLSTFGILPTFSQPELTQILDALAGTGHIECPEVDRFRPIVNLTEAGWDWLKNRPNRPIPLAISDDLSAKVRNGGLDRIATKPAETPHATEPPSSMEGDPLYQHLRALRSEWAREAKLSAGYVFSNQTLEEIVRSRPRTPQALAAVKGVGPAKLERYGAALIEAIAASPEPTTAPILAPAPRPAVGRPAGLAYVPTEEWTWRLLDRGFTLDEVVAIRGLDRSAVIRHASLITRQGKAVDPSAFLDPETLRHWDSWRAEHDDESPPPGAEPLDLWSLFIACRAGRTRVNPQP